MTFEEFQASRAPISDVDELFDGEPGSGSPGLTYLRDSHIDSYIELVAAPCGLWLLVLGNMQYCDNDLEKLEKELYNWLVDEGVFND